MAGKVKDVKISTDAKVEVTTKERILNVSVDLFAERGFDAVSLREIAEAAGIKKATLYYYFTTKDDILEQILKYVMESWNQSKAGKWSDNDEVEAQVVSMGLDGFLAMANDVSGRWMGDPRMEKIMRIAFIELYHNDQIRKFMLAFFGDGPVFFETCFAILVKHKLIKPIDPKVLTDEYMSFYMMALTDHFLLHYSNKSRSFVEEYGPRLEKHTAFFKSAVRP